ncbi:MAG: sugar kinase [Solirubrobacteraceae bacterium]
MERIVTLGEAMLRLTPSPGERLRNATRLQAFVAGAEANVATALASLGVPVSWVSALPESPTGHRVAGALAAAGVGLDFVAWLGDARLGLFFAEQADPPRASRVWYDRAGSAFAELSAVPPHALDDARIAMVSGITPALGERGGAVVQSFTEAARSAGARLCVDVNYRASLWSAAQARDGLAELIAASDIVVCSARDAKLVFGVSDAGPDAAHDLARRWAPQAEIVVLTRGDRGAVLVSDGRVVEHPAVPTHVVDRFGAGDALVAGLLWALWHGYDHDYALRAGLMLASLKCTTFGDTAQFSAEELTTALAVDPEVAIQR